MGASHQTSIIDEIAEDARTTPKLVASFFTIVQNLSASPIDAIRRPAMTTLSLVAFAQMTPLRDALSVASVETMAELTIELKRLAAGLPAVK